MSSPNAEVTYPSRTMIFWRGAWAEGAPPYPPGPLRRERMPLNEWVATYRMSIESLERYKSWWREKRDALPTEEETGGWRRFGRAGCGAHLADLRAPTRGLGTITPNLGGGLGPVAFHLETPAAILVPGLPGSLMTPASSVTTHKDGRVSVLQDVVASDAGCGPAATGCQTVHTQCTWPNHRPLPRLGRSNELAEPT